MNTRTLTVLLLGLVVPDGSSRATAQVPASATPASALPQQPGLQPATRNFSPQQLEELAAPIALYPDSLLSQVLMAATYPLEVIQAARFVQAHAGLAGSDLEAALQDQNWDPSVKSLCGFSDLLARMDGQLDWLRDLGDAFLGQQSELMDAVQRLRRTAYDAGTLRSSDQLQVQPTGERVIAIEPANDVVYVPVYYPTSVFVGWGYPHWYYPRLFVAAPLGRTGLSFGLGVAWRGALWGRCDWGPHAHVVVDVPLHNHFVERTSVRPHLLTPVARGPVPWSHDPGHRHGVNYRTPEVRQRMRALAPPAAVPRPGSRSGSSSGAHHPAFDDASRNRGQRSLQHMRGVAPHQAPSRPAPAQPRPGQRAAAGQTPPAGRKDH